MPVVIRHKISKELFQARSGKTSWKAPAHAKNAFNQSMYGDVMKEYGLNEVLETSGWYKGKYRAPRFDEQDVFEIVELQPIVVGDRLEKALALLEYCKGRCDYNTHKLIEEFLSED